MIVRTALVSLTAVALAGALATGGVAPGAGPAAPDARPAASAVATQVSAPAPGPSIDQFPLAVAPAAATPGAGAVPDVLTATPRTERPGRGHTVRLGTLDGHRRAAGPAIETGATFQTVGVTWPQGAAAPKVQLRTRSTDGTWGAWFTITPDDAAPDAGTVDAQRERAGSEPVFVGDATAVQVATVGDAGQALPSGGATLAVVASPTGTSEAASATTAETGTATVTDAVYRPASTAGGGAKVENVDLKPSMITRAQWGAAAPTCTMDVASRLVGAVVHHTADPNTYTTVAQAEQMIRNDQAYHMGTRGWCDLGYNFVVDKWGNLYEGRQGSMDQPVIGVHTGGFNTSTVGVAVLGTYDTVALSPATVATLGSIIGWRLGKYGAAPGGWMDYATGGGENSRYPAGTTVHLPVVFGHRDTAYTDCPGQTAYSQLQAIRIAAANTTSAMQYASAKSVVQSLYHDLLGRSADSAGLSSWADYLATGNSRAALVAQMTASPEYRARRIQAAYQAALGRSADATGLAVNQAAMANGTLKVDDLILNLLESQEFYARSGGTSAKFVSAMYRVALNRNAAASEQAYWSGKIATIGRLAAARNIYLSLEGAQIRVSGYYRLFLGRNPDASGLRSWALEMLAHGEPFVRQSIPDSPEYLGRAVAKYPS